MIWTYFEIKEPAFLSARNLSNLVLQIGVTGTLAIGIVLVLLLGEIDLSVGSVASLCSAVLGDVIVNARLAVVACGRSLVMLVVGAAIGAFQGFWFAVDRRAVVRGHARRPARLAGRAAIRARHDGDDQRLRPAHRRDRDRRTCPTVWGWILAVGAASVYALTHVQEQVRRRRAGLPAQPLVVVCVRAALLAAVALLVVAVLNGNLSKYWVFGRASTRTRVCRPPG